MHTEQKEYFDWRDAMFVFRLFIRRLMDEVFLALRFISDARRIWFDARIFLKCRKKSEKSCSK